MSIDRSGVVTQEMLVSNFKSIDEYQTANDAKIGSFVFRDASVATRAAALAAFPAAPVNSLIFGDDRLYLRIAAAGEAADFQKFTVSAAD